MGAVFRILPHTTADKEFRIVGPLCLIVDYDDVDHDEQDRLAEKLVEVLNNWWSYR